MRKPCGLNNAMRSLWVEKLIVTTAMKRKSRLLKMSKEENKKPTQ